MLLTALWYLYVIACWCALAIDVHGVLLCIEKHILFVQGMMCITRMCMCAKCVKLCLCCGCCMHAVCCVVCNLGAYGVHTVRNMNVIGMYSICTVYPYEYDWYNCCARSVYVLCTYVQYSVMVVHIPLLVVHVSVW